MPDATHPAAPAVIALSGLIGSHPLGALAAFGLLRWSADIPALHGARLHWEQQDDWVAVLTPPTPLAPEALCQLLLDAHASDGWAHLDGPPTLRMPAAEFRERCLNDALSARPDARFAADFDAACGCEVIARDRDGTLTPTRLDMTSAQQGLPKDLAKIAASLIRPRRQNKQRRTPLDAAREALFGPWSYPDAEPTLGWDPDAERLHALRPLAPTDDNANKSVRFAVWLAHRALALLPALAQGTRLQTSAFVVEARRAQYRLRWPLWETALGLDSLAALLTCSELTGDGNAIARLHARGVVAVYESTRHEFGQGYAVLRPARLIPPGPDERPAAAPEVMIF